MFFTKKLLKNKNHEQHFCSVLVLYQLIASERKNNLIQKDFRGLLVLFLMNCKWRESSVLTTDALI